MNFKFNTLFFALSLLITGTSLSFAASSSPKANHSNHDFFHTFSHDLSATLATAKEKNKFGLVLFFGTEHCRFCHRMKTTVFTEPSVQDVYRKHFQVLDIDIESSQHITLFDGTASTYQALAKNTRVRLTPTILFINEEGEQAYRQVGIIADPQEFIWLAQYVINGETAKQSFASFKMLKRRQGNE